MPAEVEVEFYFAVESRVQGIQLSFSSADLEPLLVLERSDEGTTVRLQV